MIALLPRLLSVALVSAFALAPAPDVTNTWSLTGNVEGVTFVETCALTQTAGTIAGTCKDDLATRTVTGSVVDTAITFSHPSEYQGTPLTLTFIGHLDDAGTTLSGAVDVQPLGYQGSFTAVKAVPATPATPPAPPAAPTLAN